MLIQNDVSNVKNKSITENDQIEIDEILEILSFPQNDDNIEQYFRNLLVDSNELELFYKMYISIRYYKYSNIIMAFNEYGIDCEGLSITEGTLELWDIENLYIYYQIQEINENLEEKIYYFNDYKMDSIDKCDYKGYAIGYPNKTNEEISKAINESINSFIRKMKRNLLLI